VRLPAGAGVVAVRGLVASPPDVESDVRRILEEVRAGGDAAVKRISARFAPPGTAPPERLRVSREEIAAALAALPAEVREALEVARAAVGAVARAQLREPVVVEGAAGQRVEVRELPVRRAGAYVPGGRAPYPSSVVMCAETARVSGVEELCVAAPAAPDGRAHPSILAACALCDVDEVYLVGGAQAVAALALGTQEVPRVDVVVGPGSPWVQEAKRQLAGVVGVDSFAAGPSELVVVATAGADPGLVALDLLAQGEHGADSPLVLVSPAPALLDAVAGEVERLSPGLRSVADAPLALLEVADARAGVALADELAPEHLELVGPDAEALAGEVRCAGCLFVGRDGATAFGDYVAGSNHVLPTAGAARWASGLGPGTFRRRMATVSLPPGAAARLAPAGAALARAEGFPVHGLSMERRA
jgi:histidinol dehydrogenase